MKNNKNSKNNIIFPYKIKNGAKVNLLTTSTSVGTMSNEEIEECIQVADKFGFEIKISKNAKELNIETGSSSPESRIEDFNKAIKDPETQMIFAGKGGYTASQIIPYLDYEGFKKNPKIFCGYSDNTVISNALFARTGVVTYSGPNFSNLNETHGIDYTLDYFKKVLFDSKKGQDENNACLSIVPSKEYFDVGYTENGKKYEKIKNPGWTVINEGVTEGTVLGGNMEKFLCLAGTEYFPNIENSILFLECFFETDPKDFLNLVQMLVQQKDFEKVEGLVFGRFQKQSGITDEFVIRTLKKQPELKNLPIIINVDFGHTEPRITFPIGGTAKIMADKNKPKIKFLKF
jgi:muramoyltetrapeptide carboxypeptidase LdcA involved in peptidoglycan recycling